MLIVGNLLALIGINHAKLRTPNANVYVKC